MYQIGEGRAACCALFGIATSRSHKLEIRVSQKLAILGERGPKNVRDGREGGRERNRGNCVTGEGGFQQRL